MTGVVTRSRFHTRDPDQAHAYCAAAYGSTLRLSAERDTDWRLDIDAVHTDSFACSQLRLPAEQAGDQVGGDQVVLETVLGGVVSIESGKTTARFLPGDAFLGSYPGMVAAMRTRQVHLSVVVLPASVLEQVAGRAAGVKGSTGAFLTHGAARGMQASWNQTAAYVLRLLNDPLITAPEHLPAGAPSGPEGAPVLLLGPLARLLGASALACFPNTYVPEPTAAESIDAHPRTLRRAVAFIESHPERDLSTADIAAAAGVSPRAVQLAFRRHLGSTPTQFLRRVRLAQAHRQLQAAGVGDGVRVAEVAARWGYTPVAFTRHYRAAYGVHPRTTLGS